VNFLAPENYFEGKYLLFTEILTLLRGFNSPHVRTVERGSRGVPQVPGLDFLEGPEILEFPPAILYKDEKILKWIELVLWFSVKY